MLYTLLNLFYISLLVVILIVLLTLGAVSTRAMWYLLSSHPYVIFASVRDKVLALLVLIVELVVLVFSAIVILHHLTGGGTNAL